jgi:hypothetical protein
MAQVENVIGEAQYVAIFRDKHQCCLAFQARKQVEDSDIALMVGAVIGVIE